MLGRLEQHWVYGGFLAGLLLLGLMPVLTAGWPVVDRLTFAVLPVYMLHQWEEHDGDRFRRFVNARIGGGAEVLSPGYIFVVNIVGVWVLSALVITLARLAAPGFGVAGAYLLLVNATLHIVQGIVLRVYNPGLLTAIALFVPLGIALMVAVLPVATTLHHGVGLAVVLGVHAAIAHHIRSRSIPA